MYAYSFSELSKLQTLDEVWRWCAVESVLVGVIFISSVVVVIIATCIFRALMYILEFLWRLCIDVRVLYIGVFYPKALIGEIGHASKDPSKPCPEVQKVLDKVLDKILLDFKDRTEFPEYRSIYYKNAVIDLTGSEEKEGIDLVVPEEDEFAQMKTQVKAEVARYHMSQAFRDVVVSHVDAARDTKSASERHFEGQEKTREETAWHKLYVETRANFNKVSNRLTPMQRESEDMRIAGFEIGFDKGALLKEIDWTIEQKIHVAKRFVADLFQSENLPVEIDELVNSDTDEKHSTEITHINTMVLCGRIYVETIDNWNNRMHYDPADYSAMANHADNVRYGHMSDSVWLKLHEKDRAERRARLSEADQYAQDLADAIESDRIIARDTAILMNVRTHRSGKTYAP